MMLSDGAILRELVECINDRAPFIHDDAETRRAAVLVEWLQDNLEVFNVPPAQGES